MEQGESEPGCFPDDASRLTRTDRERMEELSHHIWAEVWDWLDSECDVGSEVAGTIAQATAAAFEAAYRVQFEVSADVGVVGGAKRGAGSAVMRPVRRTPPCGTCMLCADQNGAHAVCRSTAHRICECPVDGPAECLELDAAVPR